MSFESYLTPLAIVLVVAAVAAAAWAVFSGKAKPLVVAAVCLLLGAAAYGADWYVVTEAEKVEALVTDLAAAVVEGDSARALSYLSPTADLPRTTVAMGLKLVQIDPDLRISDRSTTVTANNTQAVSGFRANGTAGSKQLGNSGFRFATKWQLVWRKEANEWKIVQVRRFHPITEEPIDLLSRM